MFDFSFRGTRIVFCFSFVAVAVICILLYDEAVIYLSLASSLAHEAGHLAFMKLFGVRIREIKFYGGGIGISAADEPLSYPKQILIACGGVLINLLLCIMSYSFSKTLFYINLALAIFNLLPIGYLDGAEIVSLSVHRFPRSEKVFALIKIIAVAGISAIGLYIAVKGASISALITVLFLVAASAATLKKDHTRKKPPKA